VSTLPSVIRAEHRGGYRIRVTFNDNTAKTIDFRQWLDGPVFEPLKDPRYFQNFFIDGGTVAWPNGADVAPDTLYEFRGFARRPKKRLKPVKSRGRAAASRPPRARLRG